MSASDAYDILPYDDRPVAETHPDRIFITARQAGVAVAHPQGSRVLELGCAHAVNLMPIAAHLPGACALGVDRSATQIERAATRVRESGITNLELRCADVMELDLGGERFDYVIVHGLLSWVPGVVRDRVMSFCREVLAEDGVAYLSYNTMPAWGIRGALRRALLELVGDVTSAREQIRHAREALSWLGNLSSPDESAEGALLHEEIEALRGRPDAYLLHEYLVPHSHAYWFREFVELAERAGLSFVADVAPTGLPPEKRRASIERVRERVGDPIAVEQILDVLSYRQFRASLVCRAETPRRVPAPIELLRTLRFAAPPVEVPTGASTPLDALLAPARARWPGDLPFAALASAMEPPHLDGEMTDERIAALLLEAQADGILHLRPRALPIPAAIPERPRVSALTRFEARRFPFVTTLLHECAPLDPFHAALVSRLDGTRTRAELAHEILEDVRSGRLQVDGAPALAVLRAVLPRLVEQGLSRIFEGALLVG